MIEERTVAAATCDACGKRDFSNDDGTFFGGDGFTINIVEHQTWTTHQAYACKETHLGKASRAVLTRFHEEPNGGGWSEPPTVAPVAPEAAVSAPVTLAPASYQ